MTAPAHTVAAWDAYADALARRNEAVARAFRAAVPARFAVEEPPAGDWGRALDATLGRAVALAAWGHWHPVHLHAQADALARSADAALAERCRRVAESPAEPAKSGGLFGGRRTENAPDPARQLLTECAAHLAARSVPSPLLLAADDTELIDLAHAADRAVAALDPDSEACELADHFKGVPESLLAGVLEQPGRFLGPTPHEKPADAGPFLLAEGLARLVRACAPSPRGFPVASWPAVAAAFARVGWWPPGWRGRFDAPARMVAEPDALLEALRLLAEDAIRTPEKPFRVHRLLASFLVAMLKSWDEREPVPALDPETLRPVASFARPDPQVELVPVASDEPFDTVLSLERFAGESGPGRVRLSLGPGAAEWARWLELPPPGAPPLEEARAAITAALTRPTGIDPTNAPRGRFADWLTSVEGGDWLDREARRGVGPAGASPWPAFLCEQGWLRVYPDIDWASGDVRWPAGAPLPGGTQWAFADAPPGTVLDVGRFAPTPEAARLTLSQGPRVPGTPLAVLCDLLEWASNHPGDAERFAPLLNERIDAVRRSPDAPLGADALPELVTAFHAAVEARAATCNAQQNWLALLPAHQVALDEGLSRLREAARVAGARLLPDFWTFAQTSTCPAEGVPGVDAVVAYRPDVAAGLAYRVRRWGLDAGAEVGVSAGTAPVGLTELEACLKGGNSSVERTLAADLKAWRPASLNGILESAAVDFYARYWDAHAAAHFAADAGRSAEFVERLRALLEANFGLTAFAPTAYQEVADGWLETPEGTRMRTGRVTQVLRPGLTDREGRLQLPARAEVE